RRSDWAYEYSSFPVAVVLALEPPLARAARTTRPRDVAWDARRRRWHGVRNSEAAGISRDPPGSTTIVAGPDRGPAEICNLIGPAAPSSRRLDVVAQSSCTSVENVTTPPGCRGN